jgi:hypothetical protein
MLNNGIFQQYYPALQKLAKAFYQSYRITGAVRMRFGIRPIGDSDGESVVDAYLTPLDLEASNSIMQDENGKHMQFLERMVPSAILGYQFAMQLIPDGNNDLRLELINTVAPVATPASKST